MRCAAILAVVPCALAGCGEPAASPRSEAYFKTHPAERAETLAHCHAVDLQAAACGEAARAEAMVKSDAPLGAKASR